MQLKMKTAIMVIMLCTATGLCDTFTHKETGETFDGFVTQRTVAGKTRVYNNSQQQMVTVDLNEYSVTMNSRGRKDVAIVVPIDQSETLLSEVVAKQIAQAIIEASNRGSQVIIVHIDNPGGRGDYMKIITSAIEQTKNCPVVAYIASDSYGGAFSAAAVIAMACDKVFINPSASIGAVGPMADLGVTQEDFVDYLTTYCSKSLILQGVDTEAERLAKSHQRPGLVARAFVDKQLSIVEVTNLDGKHQFILRDDLQPTQTIVRTISEGAVSTNNNSVLPIDTVRLTIKLTAQDAVDVGIADSTTGGYYDILSAMDIADSKISYTSAVKNTIKKYQAARRKMSENLTRIAQLEKQAETLEQQVSFIDEQLRMGTRTREVRQGVDDVYRRNAQSRTALPEDYANYYYDPVVTSTTFSQGVTTRSTGRRNDRTQPVSTETVITSEPTVSLATAQQELALVLEGLSAQYQLAVNLAKRWPGSLPPEVAVGSLQQNIVSTRASLSYLYTEINRNVIRQQQNTRQRTP